MLRRLIHFSAHFILFHTLMNLLADSFWTLYSFQTQINSYEVEVKMTSDSAYIRIYQICFFQIQIFFCNSLLICLNSVFYNLMNINKFDVTQHCPVFFFLMTDSASMRLKHLSIYSIPLFYKMKCLNLHIIKLFEYCTALNKAASVEFLGVFFWMTVISESLLYRSRTVTGMSELLATVSLQHIYIPYIHKSLNCITPATITLIAVSLSVSLRACFSLCFFFKLNLMLATIADIS